MKHVRLFEQFIESLNEAADNDLYFPGNLTPEIEKLLIAYYYANEATPEGQKYMKLLMDVELVKDEGTAYLSMASDMPILSISGRYVNFRGDRRKALEVLPQVIGMGKVKVPTGEYPTFIDFIIYIITKKTGKKLRLEYKNRHTADLIEYDPSVANVRSHGNIDAHPTDKVIIKDFTKLNTREVLDICIKKGFIQKPTYNF